MALANMRAMVMAPPFRAISDSHLEFKDKNKMSAMVCKCCGVVKKSRHYGVAMGLCRVGPCSVIGGRSKLRKNGETC